jgi:flagellar motor switch protein FliM
VPQEPRTSLIDGLSGRRQSALPSFDFRRPSKFGREHLRSLENLHESFTRRFASALTHALRCIVQLKPVAADEITFENYVRSLPNPSVLVVAALPPLPGNVIVEMSSPMGLLLVDRALGGFGAPVPMRRPTDLETRVLEELIRTAIGAFEETFSPVLEVTPDVVGIETNPSFVQVVPPSETTLLLSFSFVVSAATKVEGLLTVCYPFSTLHPVMDRLQRHVAAEQAPEAEATTEEVAQMGTRLNDVEVELSVSLRPTTVSAREMAVLEPGDVLRLDHRIDEPAIGLVHGVEMFDGFVGRQGKRLGVRFARWRSPGE